MLPGLDAKVNPMWHKPVMAILSLVTVLLAACAPASTAMPIPVATDTPERVLIGSQVVASPTEVSAATPTPAETATPVPFVLDLTPLPTESPIPTLELPTEVARPPALQAWDGLPTYLADSTPGYDFRVLFDPQAWALAIDAFGAPALVHRAITNCIISPTTGRGLPPNATVQQETRKINGISYQISAISLNGTQQSVIYTGGDGRILTAFEVALEAEPSQCLLEAETVLGTLESVPASQATPIATP